MNWTPHFATDAWIQRHLNRVLDDLPGLRRLTARMNNETGTRLTDWLDTLVLPQDESIESQLVEHGYAFSPQHGCWEHAGGLFPRIVVAGGSAGSESPSSASQSTPAWVSTSRGLALRVDSIDAFLAAHEDRRAGRSSDSGMISAMEMAEIERVDDTAWWVIARHGFAGVDPDQAPRVSRADLTHAWELLERRPRAGDASAGFDDAERRIETARELIGASWTADLFFACERAYWQSRNRAGQVQKARQDRLGLGWANHDHHTFRCSREHFARTLKCFETLGMLPRERFHAGAEAGWGAQVLEHPDTGCVVFADVDLSPDEVDWDFQKQPLPMRPTVGTVGLWCALHGESFLEAGMHHLECQFDYRLAVSQLAALGVPCLPPFTDLPYLKQGFTRSESWPVRPERLDAALRAGWIDEATADRFRREGAAGSHLEILQRDGGYRGFNQTGISDIIRRTDPRTIGVEVTA